MPDQTCIENFGGNVEFSPAHIYVPNSEAELLQILDKHSRESFRVGGSLHAWSEAAKTDGVFIDLKNLRDVSVESIEGRRIVSVGGGCTVHNLLLELRINFNLTMPTVGLIDKQTIAGAISTGTHGSGRHSLSHYVRSVRIAIFDQTTGRSCIQTIEAGPALRAARCSLGCMGIIVSVSFEVRPTYNVEEVAKRVPSVKAAMDLEDEYPLQQFYLLPWSWQLFTHSRRESESRRSWHAPIYRWHWLIAIDIGLHLVICLLSRTLRNASITKLFYRHVMNRVLMTNWRVVDRSDQVLTMEHALFRHIEIEIFVTEDKLESTVDFVKCLLVVLGGETNQLPERWAKQLEAVDLLEPVLSLYATYTHHYPICIRKVLPDDTSISMASGSVPRYALSFISYARARDRHGFCAFADLLAYSTAELFSARPHWGKVCPLDNQTLNSLYNELPEFRESCQERDPGGQFANHWTQSHLQLGPSE